MGDAQGAGERNAPLTKTTWESWSLTKPNRVRWEGRRGQQAALPEEQCGGGERRAALGRGGPERASGGWQRARRSRSERGRVPKRGGFPAVRSQMGAQEDRIGAGASGRRRTGQAVPAGAPSRHGPPRLVQPPDAGPALRDTADVPCSEPESGAVWQQQMTSEARAAGLAPGHAASCSWGVSRDSVPSVSRDSIGLF